MTLPIALRRLPFVFYGLAVLFFVWGLANFWLGLNALGLYPDAALEIALILQKSDALYRVSLESVYLVSAGAWLHVLIAIFDKMKGSAQ